MLEKYRATLRGDRIEWDGETPKTINKDRPQKIDVILVSKAPKLKKPDGKKMAEALAKVAAIGGVASIKDPDKWLRETRKDRPLPGRE